MLVHVPFFYAYFELMISRSSLTCFSRMEKLLKNMKLCHFFIPVSLFLIAPFILSAENNSLLPTEEFGLFNSNETLEIELKTDLKKLIKTKYDDKYQEGEIIVNNKTHLIRLRARGNNRRENCSFPPITLNFSKTVFEDKSYEQLKKLKLVN